jgi:hypothetical protein
MSEQSSEVDTLGDAAIGAIQHAVQDAPGQPYHCAWHEAHRRIDRFISAAALTNDECSRSALKICVSFLDENFDLATHQLERLETVSPSQVGRD